MDDFQMPVAFQFVVTIAATGDPEDVAFSEVSGLEIELETETVVEAGENTFVHRLPKGIKHSNLVLKRGIAPSDGKLAKWCRDVLEGGLAMPIEPRNIQVSLCDEKGDAIRTWAIARAFPVKWSVTTLSSTSNEVAIESIELAFQTVKRDK